VAAKAGVVLKRRFGDVILYEMIMTFSSFYGAKYESKNDIEARIKNYAYSFHSDRETSKEIDTLWRDFRARQ